MKPVTPPQGVSCSPEAAGHGELPRLPGSHARQPPPHSVPTDRYHFGQATSAATNGWWWDCSWALGPGFGSGSFRSPFPPPAYAVPSARPLPALPGRVGPAGFRSLARRGTAASGAGPPEQRDVRRRDSSVSPRPRPWRWVAAGPGRARSWCRHDAIAGQEGQMR